MYQVPFFNLFNLMNLRILIEGNKQDQTITGRFDSEIQPMILFIGIN